MSQGIAERAGTRTPPAHRARRWRQRNFALLWAGQTISLTGSAVTTIALPLAAITMLRASVSQQSYLPSLLDPADLTEGFGKLGASASFAQVSGRGLASGLVAVIGAARAVTADALSYAVSVTCCS